MLLSGWAVFKRELKLYFRSPIAYAVTFALLLLFGFYTSSTIAQMVAINSQPDLSQGVAFNSGYLVVVSLNLWIFLLFITAPLLTMRLLAEENREGTLEVLMTLPMPDSAIVLGKFFAVWALYTLQLALTLLPILLIMPASSLDIAATGIAYLGAFLYGGAVLAIAMIFSALTKDQVIAAFLSASLILILYLAEFVAIWASGQSATLFVVNLIRELSLQAHYQATLLQGILRVEDLVYFLFVMILALFITTRLLESRRWRAI